jgi:hypothetical protein
MSLVLDLPAELETELAAEAARLRLSLPEYALRILTLRPISQLKPRTGAELLGYWQSEGLIGTQPEISDGQEHARALWQQAAKRQRFNGEG